MKRNVMVSIDEDVIAQAKEKRINVSQSAEMGIMKKLNMNEIDETAEYPESLAKDDPDNYWINPTTNKCCKRGNPQFFETDQYGGVTPISYKQWYLKRSAQGWGSEKEEVENPEMLKERMRMRDGL